MRYPTFKSMAAPVDQRTRDLLEDCMADWRQKAQQIGTSGQSSVVEFQGLFCHACRNPTCVHHQAGDPFKTRVQSQHERLTRPIQADPNLPKYADIARKDFANLLQEAMRLEVSSRRGDWNPVDAPSFEITDGVPRTNQPDGVDEAVRRLAQAKGVEPPKMPERDETLWQRAKDLATKQGKGHIEEYAQAIYNRLAQGTEPPEEHLNPEPETPPAAPAPQHPKKSVGRVPGKGNAPAQGGMVGGGPLPEPVDPWAVPVDPRQAGGTSKKVPAGARIKLTATGEIDEG